MHQGKHAEHKKNLWFRKSFVVLASAAVIMLGVIGGTMAFLIAGAEPVTNTFSYGNVSCAVEENFGGGSKSNVIIRNTGNTEAYVRAMVIVTWKDASGNVYGRQPAAGVDYNLSIGGGWTYNNGFYYCSSAIAKGEATPVLITGCTETADNRPADGYALSVEIIADAVQSKPASAAEAAWGYAPGGN